MTESAESAREVLAARLRENADLAEKSLDFLDAEYGEEARADIELWRAAADALAGDGQPRETAA